MCKNTMKSYNLQVRIAILSDIHFGKFSRTKELAVPGEAIQDETNGSDS